MSIESGDLSDMKEDVLNLKCVLVHIWRHYCTLCFLAAVISCPQVLFCMVTSGWH